MSSNLPNPFAMPEASPKAPTEARWGIVASAPPINPTEVETEQRAVEVVVMWDDAVLHVEHKSPVSEVVLGEGGDFLLGADALGVARLPVVVEQNGRVFCVLPDGASGRVSAGETEQTFAALEAAGTLLPYTELAGARLCPLPDGASARIDHRGFTILVRSTKAAREVAASSDINWRRYGWMGISFGVHALVLTMFYFLPPTSSALTLDLLQQDDRMAEYMVPVDASVEEEVEFLVPEEADADSGGGAAHDGAEGALGDETAQPSRNRYGIQGDENDPNPEMARERAREQIESATAIGVLNRMMGSFAAPTSPYGADIEHGNDPSSALGAMFGDQIGSNFGFNGLGMNGTGRGGGGPNQGTIGTGNYQTIGHGDGPGGRYGRGIRLAGDNRPSGIPGPIRGVAEVTGSLSGEVIRRVVRRHLPEVRFCYEQGLHVNPSIEGRVAIQWVIEPTGSVQASTIVRNRTTIGSPQVESCVAQAVQRWTFPAPEGGGPVGVTYPFMLQQQR